VTDPFGDIIPRVPRGQPGAGKPLIRLEAGSEEMVPYDRASAYGKAIDDGAGLLYWVECMVAKGMAMRPSLTKAALPLDYYDPSGQQKKTLHEIADTAKTLAGAGNKAIEGTAMHSYTEIVDRGDPMPSGIDDETLADLEAYRRVTSGLTYPGIEQFVVVDEVRVAGTFDRLIAVPDAEPWPTWLRGKTFIGDLKTGKVEGAIASILIQLALYSRGALYDPTTGVRAALNVDQSVGLVLHLPLGQRSAQIIAVDLALGWQGVLAAKAAREFTARAKLGCKSCFEGSGWYKNGNACRSCQGVPRVPCGTIARREDALPAA
jgi:hypothetical protein